MNGALIFATEYDLFSIDPATCKENWRAHEEYTPASPQGVNRGAAYLDGMLFRGTQDARVLAYDFKTGKRLWETTIGDYKKGESAPAAPIAWNGLVFIGNAGGDVKGVKGRMYALDAKTGKIVLGILLWCRRPRAIRPTGRRLLRRSTAQPGATRCRGCRSPAARPGRPTPWIRTAASLYVPGGNPAPGFLARRASGREPLFRARSWSSTPRPAPTGTTSRSCRRTGTTGTSPALPSSSGPPAARSFFRSRRRTAISTASTLIPAAMLLYREPVTRMENETAPFEAGKPVHFCPGSTGGAEWNGPGYDPQTNLIYVGEVEWCTTVTLQPARRSPTSRRRALVGEASINPFNTWGKGDPVFDWAARSPPSTPTPEPGNGGRRRTIRFRAA